MIRADLSQIIELCNGDRRSTNILKELSDNITKDEIPKRWRKYNIGNITMSEWLTDFIKRIEQLVKLTGSSDFGKKGLWMGGLLFPEAYLTATRQFVA